MFGLFPIGSDELEAAMHSAEERFHVSENIGVPRYEDDNYLRVDPSSTGNYWFITAMWFAQYYNEVNRPDDARRILSWVQSHSESSGVLSEQMDPSTGALLSVAPLAWSHAEFISTLLDSITDGEK